MSSEVLRYAIWAGAVALGGTMAVIDHAVLRRWVFAVLLAAGIVGGLLVAAANPFSFGSTSYYMHGIILSGGSALALTGYALALATIRIWRHLSRNHV